MKKGALLLCLFAVILASCTHTDTSGSDENLPSLITLTCNPDYTFEPCQDIQFDQDSEVRVIMNAIENAELLPGNLNYLAKYKMSVTNTDQSVAIYDFSIGTDPKMKALLVYGIDTTTGYSISLEDSNQLRALIEKRTH
ncbi:hypothetical protein [Paenibacillus illinoisensis]|uniref:hypothetical protein n=1 Tax=Paenibacillus illinoisensis TaxID=59845 RepID=UPI001C8E5643|nr:hypothetical protein [Paenibacillus illinoisensis]MBY0218094.1 hypothetical protein [Paenibacillus illinoisensis]MCM3205765.1 hypothetical protein [Paenibacillus illinoisensis]